MAAASDIAVRESRLARRLGRLFRVERRGGFARRPPELAGHFLRRRGALIDELIATEVQRRAQAVPSSTELRQAAEALGREIRESRVSVDARIEQLETELRAARGEGMTTGMRNGAAGRVIGHG
jgi:hypothetical protein